MLDYKSMQLLVDQRKDPSHGIETKFAMLQVVGRLELCQRFLRGELHRSKGFFNRQPLQSLDRNRFLFPDHN